MRQSHVSCLFCVSNISNQDTCFCPNGVQIREVPLYTNMFVIPQLTLMSFDCGEEDIASVSPGNRTHELEGVMGLLCFSHSTAGL